VGVGRDVTAARLVRAYYRAGRRKERLAQLVNASFEGVWLGVMDRSALAYYDEAFFEVRKERLGDESHGYLEDAWNLQGLKSWEARMVEAHFPGSGRILVTGAGAGREVLALLERGFDAVGYEPNPKLVAAGNDLLCRQGHSARLNMQERDQFPSEASECDGIVVGWASYMLIPGRRRRVGFLRAGRERLAEGDPILLSLFAREGNARYSRVVAAVANGIRRLLVREPVELGDALSPMYAHHFTRDEIESELREAGFSLVDFEARPYGAHAVARAA
jgi:hypothetical protein